VQISHAIIKKGNTGILGAITGRAIYEGTLSLREAQLLLDEQQAL
jgi:phosphoribosylformimino-5-aminoimidazole carboxamide ribotide isomerase